MPSSASGRLLAVVAVATLLWFVFWLGWLAAGWWRARQARARTIDVFSKALGSPGGEPGPHRRPVRAAAGAPAAGAGTDSGPISCSDGFLSVTDASGTTSCQSALDYSLLVTDPTNSSLIAVQTGAATNTCGTQAAETGTTPIQTFWLGTDGNVIPESTSCWRHKTNHPVLTQNPTNGLTYLSKAEPGFRNIVGRKVWLTNMAPVPLPRTLIGTPAGLGLPVSSSSSNVVMMGDDHGQTNAAFLVLDGGGGTVALQRTDGQGDGLLGVCASCNGIPGYSVDLHTSVIESATQWTMTQDAATGGFQFRNGYSGNLLNPCTGCYGLTYDVLETRFAQDQNGWTLWKLTFAD